MLTVTIAEGRELVATGTTPSAVADGIILYLDGHRVQMPLDIREAIQLLRGALIEEDYRNAARHAEALGFTFILTASRRNQPDYDVPVDPADETNCEACQ